jgi:pilus assembly protein CpaB
MNRTARTFIVIAISIVLAGASTYLVYRTIQNRPARVVEVAHAYAVVAAHPIALGTMLTPSDVKLIPWPAANPVPGGFGAVNDVVGHGVVSPIAQNEPITSTNVATKEAGAGLPPTIPPGMRAISVKVNEVIGVAGFVVPGTRVDVMVILKEGNSSLAKVVCSNVQVLTAGTKYDQEVAREGKAIPSSVVTLLLSPDDAARVGLAASEGQIMLTLRNPMDAVPTQAHTLRTTNLVSDSGAPADARPAPVKAARATPKVTPAPEPPPPAPAPPPIYSVEVIKAGKRSQETIK